MKCIVVVSLIENKENRREISILQFGAFMKALSNRILSTVAFAFDDFVLATPLYSKSMDGMEKTSIWPRRLTSADHSAASDTLLYRRSDEDLHSLRGSVVAQWLPDDSDRENRPDSHGQFGYDPSMKFTRTNRPIHHTCQRRISFERRCSWGIWSVSRPSTHG